MASQIQAPGRNRAEFRPFYKIDVGDRKLVTQIIRDHGVEAKQAQVRA